ncbi:hypothetical protein T492DRAFT_1029742 [Pavlovales sp. CCMP2436]|nr:hypothetical protein T492DRAFT_1029742 [Pavlovales sp. CCMP2436]
MKATRRSFCSSPHAIISAVCSSVCHALLSSWYRGCSLSQKTRTSSHFGSSHSFLAISIVSSRRRLRNSPSDCRWGEP